jgi:DNA repair protein RadC
LPTTEARNTLKLEGEMLRLWSRILQTDINELTELDVLSSVLHLGQKRQDSARLAYALLQKYGSFGKVLSAPLPELLHIKGVSEACALSLKTVAMAAQYLVRSEVTKRPLIKNRQHLQDYLQSVLGRETREHFRVIFLDAKNKIIKEELLAKGTVNDVTLYPREVIKHALSLNATALLLIHNHPSGDATPSDQDVIWTKHFQTVCAEIGIKLHDHVIVANGQYFSMSDHGLLNKLGDDVQSITTDGV